MVRVVELVEVSPRQERYAHRAEIARARETHRRFRLLAIRRILMSRTAGNGEAHVLAFERVAAKRERPKHRRGVYPGDLFQSLQDVTKETDIFGPRRVFVALRGHIEREDAARVEARVDVEQPIVASDQKRGRDGKHNDERDFGNNQARAQPATTAATHAARPCFKKPCRSEPAIRSAGASQREGPSQHLEAR